MTNIKESTKILIEREYFDTHTYGRLTVIKNDRRIFKCFTIEKPWKDNKQNESCIPEGTYKADRIAWSTKTKGLPTFMLKDVPNRTSIQIHIANWEHELLGCIAIGKHKRIMFGKSAITDSEKALKELMELLENDDEVEIEIKELIEVCE